MYINKKNTNIKKGSAFYFTILLLSIIMGISFGLNSILMSQINITRRAGNSVMAFYAADSGIEKVLNNRNDPESISEEEKNGELENGATYEIEIKNDSDAGCDARNYCIVSRGTYKETTRAIRVTY